MPSNLRWWTASLVFVLGCGPSYPRLTIEKTGIGDEGGQLTFSIDAEGRFQRESRGDTGTGTIVWKRCKGSLGTDEVAEVFAALEQAELGGAEKRFGDESNPRERTLLVYARSSTEERFPVDDAEFQRLEALVMGLYRGASAIDANCKEGREKD